MAEEKNELGQMVNQAVNQGFRELLKQNPRFKGFEGYIQQHLDSDGLNNVVAKLSKEYRGDAKAIYTGVVGYVASGEILDDEAKTTLLNYDLKKSSERNLLGAIKQGKLIETLKARGDLRKRGKLEKMSDDVARLSELLSEDYAQALPEITEIVQDLNQYRFKEATARVLYEQGRLNKQTYNVLQTASLGKMGEGLEKVTTSLVDSYGFKKAATLIGLFSGFSLLFSQSPLITGGVIGTISNRTNPLFYLGILIITISGYFGYKLLKSN